MGFHEVSEELVKSLMEFIKLESPLEQMENLIKTN